MRYTQLRTVAVLTSLALVATAAGFGSLALAVTTTAPTTNAATAITSSDATLNGTNGNTAATDSSFWVATSTFSVASSTTPVMPAGVYSTPDLNAQAASAAFSASLSSAVGLPSVTPGTTYYYAAWTEVGGVWSPGAVVSFTTISAPTITNISPASGTTAGGTSITITGTDFASGATVTIGGTPATSVVVASSTEITATTPAGIAGAANVVVSNTDSGTVTSTGSFTYVAPISGAPTVSSISPTTGTTAGGTSVVITGTNLTGATAVDFGTVPATITATTSDTSITATSPATSTAGAVDVTVVTPSGTSTISSADQFTYTALSPTAPVISNIMAMATGTSTATISWTTDSAASSQVAYGTTASYGATSTLDTTMTTSHSVMLTGLNEATLYHFDVSSGNVVGTTTSADNEFVSQSTSSSTPLAVTGVDTEQSTATAGGGFGEGWQWTMHLTVPDNENAFQMQFSDFTASGSSSTIPAAGDIQIYSPESSNASSSSSALLSPGNDQWTGWLYLTGDTQPLTAGRQIDVIIQAQVPTGTAGGTYSTNYAAQSVPSTATSTTP